MRDLQLTGSPVNDIATLEALADEIIESHYYTRKLSEDELAEVEHEFGQTSLEIQRAEEEMKGQMQVYKDRIKRLKSKAATDLQMIKTGQMETNETVYEITDISEGRVGLYTMAGKLISERPIKGPRQMGLGSGSRLPYVEVNPFHDTTKTGTNG